MVTNRHEFSAAVRTSLAHRAGFSCANPDCRAHTAGPSEESELARSDVGVASHITAASPGGPRYDASLSESDRTSIDNGVWLCQVCAKKIDDDVVTYPSDLLRRWKHEVEADAANRLGRPSAATIEQARKCDPLERMIAHRMRDALAAATFPIAMLLPRSVGNDAAYPLSQLLSAPPAATTGSEFVESSVVFPIVDALATHKLLEPAEAPFAPDNARWIDWILTGFSACAGECEQALNLYASRGPSVLVAQFEQLVRHIRSTTRVLSALAMQRPEELISETGRSYFAQTLKVLMKAQRTWLDFLTDWQR